MKYFLSSVKYIALGALMANTCVAIYYLFFGDVLDIVISIIREICLFIETYIFTLFAEGAWICYKIQGE